MATRFVSIFLAAGIAVGTLAGCAAEDDVLFVAYNAYADPTQNCELNSALFISPGRFDLVDSYLEYPTDSASHTISNPKNYSAAFLLRTNGKESGYGTPQGRAAASVYNYGGLPTNDILVEEIEVRFDFANNTILPSSDTLAAIPSGRVQPASTWVGPKTRAGKTATLEGTAFLPVELIATDIGTALSVDTEIYDSLNYPNKYLISVELRVRGRTTGGARIQSEWSTYPLELCRGCLTAITACHNTCYPPWQDC